MLGLSCSIFANAPSMSAPPSVWLQKNCRPALYVSGLMPRLFENPSLHRSAQLVGGVDTKSVRYTMPSWPMEKPAAYSLSSTVKRVFTLSNRFARFGTCSTSRSCSRLASIAFWMLSGWRISRS